MAVVVEEDLQDVQHAGHLSEDEHSVGAQLQLVEEGVQSLQLACSERGRGGGGVGRKEGREKR